MENILKEAPKVYLMRECTPIQGTLPLTHMGYPQSTKGYYIKTQSQTRILEVKQIKVQRQS